MEEQLHIDMLAAVHAEKQKTRRAAQVAEKAQEGSRRAAEEAEKARQDSAIGGFAQGLGYLATKRVDLSGQFGAVTEDQIKVVACRSSDLEALFLPIGTQLSDSTLAAVREACPRATCLELGCEINEKAFLDLCAQHERHDHELASLLPNAELWQNATAALSAPPEGITGNSTRASRQRISSEFQTEPGDGTKPSEPEPEPDPSEFQTEPGDGTKPSEPEPELDPSETEPGDSTKPSEPEPEPDPSGFQTELGDGTKSSEPEPVERIFSDSVEGNIEKLKHLMKQAIDAEEFDDLEHLQQEMKEVRSTPAVK
eukprot:COSAG02_NODE_9604_length_2164_cov_47.511864_1_plen_311_part_10